MTPTERQIPVLAYTRLHKIEGLITLFQGEKVADKLNMIERKYESLQDVQVSDLQTGKILHTAPWMAVNKDALTLLLPADEAPA